MPHRNGLIRPSSGEVAGKEGAEGMRHRARRLVALALLGWGLAGCVSGPKPLLQCEGPWDPVNAVTEVRDGQ